MSRSRLYDTSTSWGTCDIVIGLSRLAEDHRTPRAVNQAPNAVFPRLPTRRLDPVPAGNTYQFFSASDLNDAFSHALRQHGVIIQRRVVPVPYGYASFNL